MAIYNGKHVVFEQVGVEDTVYMWNSSDNPDDNNCYNNYSESKIRDNLNQTIIEYLSNDLQSELVATTIQTAKNGLSSTLISTTDKLFLSAGKEISSSPSYCVSQENSALTTWNYYITHSSQSDRVKYDSTSTARAYWLRSPNSGYNDYIIRIFSNGNFGSNPPTSYYVVATCFAW